MVLKRRALVVLEGGGAKGVAHAGALAAIEDAGYAVSGVAGTSAGSLVAALSALGLSARDILDPPRRRSVLNLLDPPLGTAPELLGPEWRKIAIMRRFLGPLPLWWPMAAALGTVAAAAAGTWLAGRPAGLAAAATVLALIALVGLGYGLAARVVSGVARLDPVERQLDTFARARLGKDTPVTFADLKRAGKPGLKMVATDLTASSMQVFSAERTPDVRVSEAVVASACLPMAFAPRRITSGLGKRGSHAFTDGGLVSNLPAWVFDAERTRDPGLVTICVELTEPESRPPGTVSGTLGQYVRAAAFGAGDLSVRGIPRRINVAIPVPDSLIATTDFDATWDDIAKVVQSARDLTEARLLFEDLMTGAARGIARRMAERFGLPEVRLTLGYLRAWERDAILDSADHPVSLSPAYRAPESFAADFSAISIGADDAIARAVRTGEARTERIRGTERWRLAMPPLAAENPGAATGDALFLLMIAEGDGNGPVVEIEAENAYLDAMRALSPLLD